MDISQNINREENKDLTTIIENIPKIEPFNKLIDYFEHTWFSINNSENASIYEFSIWNYSSKFKFKGTKTLLFKEGEIDEYIFFSNNAVESFNHLINQCLDNNTKVSISKFEEILNSYLSDLLQITNLKKTLIMSKNA